MFGPELVILAVVIGIAEVQDLFWFGKSSPDFLCVSDVVGVSNTRFSSDASVVMVSLRVKESSEIVICDDVNQPEKL